MRDATCSQTYRTSCDNPALNAAETVGNKRDNWYVQGVDGKGQTADCLQESRIATRYPAAYGEPQHGGNCDENHRNIDRNLVTWEELQADGCQDWQGESKYPDWPGKFSMQTRLNHTRQKHACHSPQVVNSSGVDAAIERYSNPQFDST